MIARMVLPLLGGSPAVWNTCVVFFQAVLLLGYAYAHAGAAWLGARRQAVLQAAGLVAGLWFLPLGARSGEGPTAGANPIPWLLGVLVTSIGLPFLALSGTSPILQRLLAAAGAGAGGGPHFPY